MANLELGLHPESARVPLLNDPKIRGFAYQLLVFVAFAAFVYWVAGNTIENLARSNIASGFDFLRGRSGFDVGQSLIEYSSDSTNFRALLVGLLNTLLVAVAGIVTASVVGFAVGVGRLSHNWLIGKICTVYVEIFRNIPPLLVIFFWYLAVLALLPLPRDSIELPFGAYLNGRGLFLPRTVWGPGAWMIPAALLLAIVLSWLVVRRARARQLMTGQRPPVLWLSLGLVAGLPLLAFAAAGFPLSIDYPRLGTFNLGGGFQIRPEFMALYLALSFYTASFIAEIVRGGVLGVDKGQTEAALALGLRRGQVLRQVVVPQALRIIIPPLTNQYLNLTKNSSLAIAVGYADLVAVGGTILNQTGQAIEVVAIWMIIYLGLSFATAILMNWFNARIALVER